MIKCFYLPLIFMLSNLMAEGQELKTITKLPSQVNETSGIEISTPNNIWTFNDSGGSASLYLCDTLGNLVRTVSIQGAWNRDWEDLAQDDQGNFYIGNIGNNSNSETDLSVFKIPNPDLISGNSIQAEVITFSYEDQNAFPPVDAEKNFDCETLFWHDDYLYICSKNRTVPFDGITYLYRFSDNPGNYVAEKIGQFNTGGFDTFDYWITAGDISPDGSKVCLLSSDKMWVFYDYQQDDFFGGKNTRINFPSSTQKEAIAFVDNETVYITDEDWGTSGRNLYRLELPQLAGPYGGVPHVIPGVIEAEFYDYGGNGVGYYDLTTGNEGGEFRQDDVDVEENTDFSSGYNVGWFEKDEWLQYTVDVEFGGDFLIAFRTASEIGASAYIEIDQVKVGESFDILETGGWQNWKTTSVSLDNLTAGEHTFRLVMESGGFNLNFMDVSSMVTGYVPSEAQFGFKVYPNPTLGLVHVLSQTDGLLQIHDVSGQLIVAKELAANETYELGEMNAGAYFYSLISSGKTITKRIMKE